MESEEQLNTYSNLVENVQHLHETQQNPICETENAARVDALGFTL